MRRDSSRWTSGYRDLQRFHIHKSSDFQGSNVVVGTVSVVAAGMISVETDRIVSAVSVRFSAEIARNARYIFVGTRLN